MPSDRDALEQLRAVSDVDAIHTVNHYLYFPLEQAAREVANIFRGRGFIVEERLGADGVNWLVMAMTQIVPTEPQIREMRTLFEGIAEEHEGEYDGWEVAPIA